MSQHGVSLPTALKWQVIYRKGKTESGSKTTRTFNRHVDKQCFCTWTQKRTVSEVLRLSASREMTMPLPPRAVIMKPALMTEMMARPSAFAMTWAEKHPTHCWLLFCIIQFFLMDDKSDGDAVFSYEGSVCLVRSCWRFQWTLSGSLQLSWPLISDWTGWGYSLQTRQWHCLFKQLSQCFPEKIRYFNSLKTKNPQRVFTSKQKTVKLHLLQFYCAKINELLKPVTC